MESMLVLLTTHNLFKIWNQIQNTFLHMNSFRYGIHGGWPSFFSTLKIESTISNKSRINSEIYHPLQN